MKFLCSILILVSATSAFTMNKTVKNRFHDGLINHASDNAYCKLSDLGSEDGEPLNAIIPKQWRRSLPYEPDDQERMQEAIKKMQEKRNTLLRQATEDGSCLCLATAALTCYLATHIYAYLK